MSLIEGPNIAVHQAKKKERSWRDWTQNFSTHCNTYVHVSSIRRYQTPHILYVRSCNLYSQYNGFFVYLDRATRRQEKVAKGNLELLQLNPRICRFHALSCHFVVSVPLSDIKWRNTKSTYTPF